MAGPLQHKLNMSHPLRPVALEHQASQGRRAADPTLLSRSMSSIGLVGSWLVPTAWSAQLQARATASSLRQTAVG